MFDLTRRRAQNVTLMQTVETKEREAQTANIPTVEEETRWTAQEQKFKDILLPDEAVPQLFEDLSRIAYDNHLQRLEISTEEKQIDVTKQPQPPADSKLNGLGIRRYMSIRLKFQGDYPDVAKFLVEVSLLSRPVEFRNIDLNRSLPLIDAVVVLSIYKREPA